MMITAIATETPIAAIGLSDFRNRLASGERSLLPNSTAPATGLLGAGDHGRFTPDTREPAPVPPEPEIDRSTIFAAAVIAGALSPTPQSMEQLIMRIGSSTIPAESEARLKDLLA